MLERPNWCIFFFCIFFATLEVVLAKNCDEAKFDFRVTTWGGAKGVGPFSLPHGYFIHCNVELSTEGNEFVCDGRDFLGKHIFFQK